MQRTGRRSDATGFVAAKRSFAYLVGPFDIKYHVISIVAIFIALGTGIIIGSNLIGTSTVVEQQNTIIKKIETTFQQLRQDMREAKKAREEAEKQSVFLESTVIPRLLKTRLDGVKLGVFEFDSLQENDNTFINRFSTLLNGADGNLVYKVNLPLQDLETIFTEFQNSAENQGINNAEKKDKTIKSNNKKNNKKDSKESLQNPQELINTKDIMKETYLKKIAGEIHLGTSFSYDFTKLFRKKGQITYGNFRNSVDGILFIIGEQTNESSVQNYLIPLELFLKELNCHVVNAFYGDNNSTVLEILTTSDLPVIKKLGNIESQIDVIMKFQELLKPSASPASESQM